MVVEGSWSSWVSPSSIDGRVFLSIEDFYETISCLLLHFFFLLIISSPFSSRLYFLPCFRVVVVVVILEKKSVTFSLWKSEVNISGWISFFIYFLSVGDISLQNFVLSLLMQSSHAKGITHCQIGLDRSEGWLHQCHENLRLCIQLVIAGFYHCPACANNGEKFGE